jgi:uncharacterized protein YndB with AHSA1/START domain
MEKITVQGIINESVEKVWDIFTKPEHITKWNHASEDWHCPRAENDLRAGGRFTSRMEAKDGSEGFDFTGVYDEVVPRKKIAYTMDDGRKAQVMFEEMGNSTAVTTTFDPENENPLEMQKAGWQAILDTFKTYTEAN